MTPCICGHEKDAHFMGHGWCLCEIAEDAFCPCERFDAAVPIQETVAERKVGVLVEVIHALSPYVDHKPECRSKREAVLLSAVPAVNRDLFMVDTRAVELPCTCGLYATVEAALKAVSIAIVPGASVPIQPWQRHRWSGWPGAICLYCGESDPAEICLADHDKGLLCLVCGEPVPNPGCDVAGHKGVRPCPDHSQTPCLAGDPAYPDPYKRPYPLVPSN